MRWLWSTLVNLVWRRWRSKPDFTEMRGELDPDVENNVWWIEGDAEDMPVEGRLEKQTNPTLYIHSANSPGVVTPSELGKAGPFAAGSLMRQAKVNGLNIRKEKR